MAQIIPKEKCGTRTGKNLNGTKISSTNIHLYCLQVKATDTTTVPENLRIVLRLCIIRRLVSHRQLQTYLLTYFYTYLPLRGNKPIGYDLKIFSTNIFLKNFNLR